MVADGFRLAIATGWTSLTHVVLPGCRDRVCGHAVFWPWASTTRSVIRCARSPSLHEDVSVQYAVRWPLVPASDLPWEYLPTYILLALPS